MVRYADDIVVGFEHQADAGGFEHQADAGRFWEGMRTGLADFASWPASRRKPPGRPTLGPMHRERSTAARSHKSVACASASSLACAASDRRAGLARKLLVPRKRHAAPRVRRALN